MTWPKCSCIVLIIGTLRHPVSGNCKCLTLKIFRHTKSITQGKLSIVMVSYLLYFCIKFAMVSFLPRASIL
ncbi:unnamed protein product [Leptidea sinapis]|uniref:Uncharacterized protein n=1 Tax=Leptidea sinapis TaxID=189913 RepID=A0A5E4R0R4_9NEOP|nr:unnamed protein product [Leptidea sinapis]